MALHEMANDANSDAYFPASRVDAETRVDVGFFGRGSSRLFGSVISSPEEPLGGVVICPPLHADFSKNYRNEVLLGQALARQGFAVLRFHYRGQGHSDGDPRSVSLESLTKDAVAAVDFLRSRIGVERLGLVGCRLGAFIAAAAAASLDGAPVSLWEPVVDPGRYLRDAIRARLIGDLRGRETERASADALMEQLHREGFVDIHGYPIHLGLVQSMEGKMLPTELGDNQRPILLVEISRGRDLRREYASLVDEWSSKGLPVEVLRIAGEVGWWFRGGHQEREDVNRLGVEALGVTVDWMRTNVAVGQAG